LKGKARVQLGAKKLKEYWQRNSPAVPGEAKSNRKTNGSNPETSTSDGCHSPEDSLCQEQAVVLDSRSVKISRLNNTIKSLVRVQWGPLIPRCQSWAPVSSWGSEERGWGPWCKGQIGS
uniref:Uncharacterized protein n=1 Tax=Macaca fascicularis TaxID=9541 RepID=A0A7N9IGG1_MACFA